MSLGIPVIATDTEINRGVIIHNKTGLLVKNENEWLNALKKLIENKSIRAKMSKNSVSHVKKNFSVEVNKHKYLEIINKVIKQN